LFLAGDRLLFYNFNYCLNLGSFSNISFEKKVKRITYDISSVNIILNFYASRFDLDYDYQGRIFREGTFDSTFFKNKTPFL